MTTEFPFPQEVQKVVLKVIGRFVNLRKATARFDLREKLKGTMLDQLIEEGYFIERERENYVPGIIAFETCGDDFLLKLGKSSAELVLQTLKSLYKTTTPITSFSRAEVKEHAAHLYGFFEEEKIHIGLSLVAEIGNDVLAGWEPKDGLIATVAVREDILDFETIEEFWEKAVERRSALRRREGKKEAVLATAEQSKADSQRNVLFISHAAVDHDIASLLKENIRICFTNCAVFVSSDPESLPPRDPWVKTVLDNLSHSALVLVLATARGLSRHWVWFEAGASWAETPQFLTCCLGAIHKGGLPAPFALYTALDIGNEKDLAIVFNEIAKYFQGTGRPDYSALSQQLKQLDSKVTEAQKIETNPFADELRAVVRTTMQRLSPAQIEALKRLLVLGSATDHYMLQELAPTGLAASLGSVLPGLQNVTPFVQPIPNPHIKIPAYDQAWEIKPEFKPYLQEYFKKRDGVKA